MADLLLAVKGLNAWYGESHILHGMEFDVREGEVVTLLGRNGAGKTTTMKAIMGMVGRRQGSIRFRDAETIGLASNKVARLGIAICPEERGIFASLDVEENLLLPPQISDGGMPLAQIYELFPNLKERLRSQGTKLSGGEQQMLAIARAMTLEPKIILLDEPTEGLMPRMVAQIREIIDVLRRDGLAILLVEQNVPLTLEVCARVYIMEKGQVRYRGPAGELRANETIIHQYLGVSA